MINLTQRRSAHAGAGRLLPTIFTALLLLSPISQASEPADAVSAETRAAILKADSDLFAIVFGSCRWADLQPMIARDLEFYHDRHGRIATSRDQFIASIRDKCHREATGVDYRARRERDEDSISLHALGTYGVLETGTHRFFRKHADGSETLVEQAQFAQIWRRDGKHWKLARVISYSHEKLAAID